MIIQLIISNSIITIHKQGIPFGDHPLKLERYRED